MLPESQRPIDVRFFLLLIPVAYFSYMFHEFGHWILGEILGNHMVYSLNLVWPRDGHYLHASNDLLVSLGGPGFSLLQAAIALLVVEKSRTLLIVIRCSYRLHIGAKMNGYIVTVCTACQLLVIGTYQVFKL